MATRATSQMTIIKRNQVHSFNHTMDIVYVYEILLKDHEDHECVVFITEVSAD